MRIGIVSDTHGNVNHTVAAVEVLQQQDVELVLHCGDVGGPGIVPLFEHWPTHFVAGNCDDRQILAQEVQAAGQYWHDLFGEITVENKRIALLHGHVQSALDQVIHTGHYDFACYGHTHRYEKHRVKQTLVINPGALHRAHPHTIAIIELSTMTARHLEVDCQRGSSNPS